MNYCMNINNKPTQMGGFLFGGPYDPYFELFP